MRDIGGNWLEIGLHCKILRNIIKVDNKGIHLKKVLNMIILWSILNYYIIEKSLEVL